MKWAMGCCLKFEPPAAHGQNHNVISTTIIEEFRVNLSLMIAVNLITMHEGAAHCGLMNGWMDNKSSMSLL